MPKPVSLPDAAAAAQPLERTLSYRMHQVYKLTDQESQRRCPQATGLTLGEGRCLAVLGAFESLSVNQLAQAAHLDKAQASRAAQSLADQGLVHKADAADDGRCVQLTLTPAGRKAWRKTMEFVHRRNQDIFGCLSAQEQRTLGDLFDRLIAHASACNAAARDA